MLSTQKSTSKNTKIFLLTKTIKVWKKYPKNGFWSIFKEISNIAWIYWLTEYISINFTVQNKKFCLSLHYNRENSYLFVNGKEIHKLKAKDFEIVATPLCLGNVSKDWSVDMKKTGLNGYVYDFSVDCVAITADDILDIHNYLMKKNGIV